MRKDLLPRGLGIGLGVVLLLGILSVAAMAQNDEGLLPFPTTMATITLTDSGLDISPSQLSPGPVIFTVQNNSGSTRGVYVTGDDRVGDPLLRYSSRVLPGASTTMPFWLYEGQNYTFRDFTSRRISGGDSMFNSSYSTRVSIGDPLPLGSGPSYDWMTGRIVISDTGIDVTPKTSDHGPIAYTVVNQTNSTRGVILKGADRTGSPIFRFSRLIPPGGSATVNFWLYEGQTYTVQDYSRAGMVRGAPQYTSGMSTTVSVNPSTPAEGTGLVAP